MERIERGHADEASRQASLLAEGAGWFERVKQFRETEMEMMVLEEPGAAEMRLHRAYLVQILAQGESLAIRVRLHGLPQNQAGITAEAIDAELVGLGLTQAQWHSGMTAVRKSQLLRELLSEQESKA